MTAEDVTFELRDDVAVIRMDDGKANALSPGLVKRLGEAFDRAEVEAKAIVLQGRPGRFSAGFDLKVMTSGPEAARELVTAGGELMMRIYEHPKPVVVAVTGHAIAGGVLLAACGDLRLGVRGDFKLGLNEVANGMPVPILAHELARDRLLRTELVNATLFATLYSPEEAVRAGWLDAAVSPDALEAEAFSKAKTLGELPAKAYAQTKRSLRREVVRHIRSTMQANMEEFAVGN